MNQDLSTTSRGFFTRDEIYSQPDAWHAALSVLAENLSAIHSFAPVQGEPVIFTGCGSTYYLALAAASLTQQMTGLSCRAFPASELWLYPQSSYVKKKTLLVALSRSGATTETLKACEAFLEDKRGHLLTLSCYGDTPLAGMGGLNIVLPSGQEHSIAQTRAFSTLYLAAVALSCLWSGQVSLFSSLYLLPEAGRQVLEQSTSVAADLGPDASIDRFYWLGSGPRYGLAAELSLKMKEMSLTHSESFHFLEFRHGPKSMVTGSSLVIGLRSTLNEARERAVMQDVESLGGRILDIGESSGSLSIQSRLVESVRDVLYLPVGQLIAFERSLSKGLNPDLPNNLDSVVKLQGGEES